MAAATGTASGENNAMEGGKDGGGLCVMRAVCRVETQEVCASKERGWQNRLAIV